MFRSMLVIALLGAVATAQAQIGPVEGWIDGVFGPAGAQYIQGWACEPNNPNPLIIHLYTGGAAGVGQLYNGYVANAANEPAVSSACGSNTGHRFFINVTGDLFSRAGQTIFIHGIAQHGGPNNLLNGSGTYSIPATTTVGVVDSVSAGGFAAGWAFDNLNTGASIQVAIYADGNGSQGAESGTLVWQGVANQPRPDVDAAYNITGNHGFGVQLPASVTTGVHSLSLYPVSVNGGVGGPMVQSPTVAGASKLTSQFSFSTSAQGFPGLWFGYTLPAGSLNLVGLSGTVSMNNTANIFSEMLFVVTYLPAGTCPTTGSNAQFLPGTGPVLWTDIIKGPTTGTFTAPVSFTLPVGVPMSSCFIVGINGGTVAAQHTVTGTVNLVATYTQGAAAPTQLLGLDNEFCFGQNWGCQLATTDDTKSFAAVTQITQRSSLNAIWGNISDSTFDGNPPFGPLPTGPWTALNDVYVYHGTSCQQFPPNRSMNGPGNYYSQIPADATHLVSAPLSGGAGAAPGETISYLLPGFMNGAAVYQTFSNVTLNPGDCLVSLYGLTGTTGGFDNEDQLRALVTPF
jgi:hypothetical protein